MAHTFKGERTLMRIFIGESDKYQGRPLYEVLLERFRAKGLAGATVLRGVAGVGASSRTRSMDAGTRWRKRSVIGPGKSALAS